jgi:uncharacterized protein YkwD
MLGLFAVSNKPTFTVTYLLEHEVPATGNYSSNHILVNQARQYHGQKPLKRNTTMDNVARRYAQRLAECDERCSFDKRALERELNAKRIAINVQRGESIRAMHDRAMAQWRAGLPGKERTNMLCSHCTSFGVGTAKGKDGQLHMCQIFIQDD